VELRSDVTRHAVWERLTELVDGPIGVRLGLSGYVTTHQFVLTMSRGRCSIPWRATFRGTVLTTKGGTVMTGKFDSNWSQYFLGYPVVLAVFANVLLNVLAGRAAGRLGEFTVLCAGAAAFCAVLARKHRRDQARISETLHAIMNVPRAGADRQRSGISSC
jgi:hypothetical protein